MFIALLVEGLQPAIVASLRTTRWRNRMNQLSRWPGQSSGYFGSSSGLTSLSGLRVRRRANFAAPLPVGLIHGVPAFHLIHPIYRDAVVTYVPAVYLCVCTLLRKAQPLRSNAPYFIHASGLRICKFAPTQSPYLFNIINNSKSAIVTALLYTPHCDYVIHTLSNNWC